MKSASAPSFVHLRLHTEFSLQDSVVRIPELVERAVALGMPAVAVTDQNNLFAMVKFYREGLKCGVKPIIGVDVLLRSGERLPPNRLTLLCKDPGGYQNITNLVTRAWLEGQEKGVPLLARDWLTRETTSGLIALSGFAEGDVGRTIANGREADALTLAQEWKQLFGDRYYLELQRLGRADDESMVAKTVSLSQKAGISVVATNDVRFLAASDFESHEARVCISDGAQLADPARQRRYTEAQYLRSPEEMAALFADIPEALANSVEIARRCSLPLKLGESRLPNYPLPDGETVDAHIRAESLRGFAEREKVFDATQLANITVYRDRLERELGVICQMGFPGYFLIVADFIRWARANGVPVGPGRGSGAGSLVAYSLGITDIDPLKYDLLFERFLNPERVSMPDFDIDFCMDGRDRVIEYVSQKYGRERVSQIITYGTMAAKAVVRDVGRVLGMGYGYVDKIAKLIPFELGITLKDAIDKEPELARLYKEDEEVKNLIDLAMSLEGLTRNAGMHAGGVVIAPSKLTEFAPLYADDKGGSVVTQFDKDDVEAAGLVKFDFLGLRTLTVIDRAVKIINARRAAAGEALLDISQLPMDDQATYDLMALAKTTAVFQLESRGMKDLIRRLKPDRFEDIVALVALFRPGPLESGMVGDFIDRKHSRNDPHAPPIDYLHPSLQPVLAPTYGVILYQEQVMQIAQVLASYTLGGADLLRRAMGKKKPEEMAKERGKFVSGSVKNGVPEGQAAHIFDLMEKFAGYGFNKSHSAAYALLSYQTGWLKTHEAASYMAAVLSADMDHTDKVVGMLYDCRKEVGLTVLPPHVNLSSYEFAVVDDKTIRYGLGAIKGVGQGAVESIVAERKAHGDYGSLEDLCRRLDMSKINRRVLEALIKSGSLDGLASNRATLMGRLDAALALGEQNSKANETGQHDIFGLSAAHVPEAVRASAPDQPEWTDSVRLRSERETLGRAISGHPIDRFVNDLPRFITGRIVDYIDAEKPQASAEGSRSFFGGKPVSIAGVVEELRKRGPRTSVVLDDDSGRIECSFFDEQYQQYREILVKDALLLIEGKVRFDEFANTWVLRANKVSELERLREKEARRIVLKLKSTDRLPLEKLQAILAQYRGGACQVSVQYYAAGARGTYSFGADWNVRPAPALTEELEKLLGRGRIAVLYSPPPVSAEGGSPLYPRAPMAVNFLDFEQPIAELEAKIEELKHVPSGSAVNIQEEITRLQAKSEQLTQSIFANLTPWQITQLARHPQRPYTLDYAGLIFKDFQELHGDRMYGDDLAIIGGPARLDDTPVMLIGHQKGRDTKERVRRNYGMPKPEGYRKALRLMRLAERFRLPLITLIDTPGAYPGVGSEERNQSEAIARNLFEMSVMGIPIISCVIGEGGSGGALAIGVCDRLLMLQFSTYSVISPEGCASILWKSADKKEVAADAMNLTADRLFKLKLVDEVLPEPVGGAHRDAAAVASTIKTALVKHLTDLQKLAPDKLRAQRNARIDGFGVFSEVAS